MMSIRHSSKNILEAREKRSGTEENSDYPQESNDGKRSVLYRLITEIDRGRRQRDTDERNFWNRQIKVAELLNLVTFVAAIAAVLGLVFVGRGLQESRYATIASNRAWLAPIGVSVRQPIKSGAAIRYLIQYKNVGKSPATNMTWFTDQGVVDIPSYSLVEDGHQIINGDDIHIANYICQDAAPVTHGDIVYPEQQAPDLRSQSSYYGINKVVANDDIVNAKKMFFVRGCVAYKTIGIIGLSSYCFVMSFHNGYVRGNPFPCPGANDAK
jgi:hypothetical protein